MIIIVMATVAFMVVKVIIPLEIQVTLPIPSITLTMNLKTITIVTILLKGFQTNIRVVVMTIGINFGGSWCLF